MSMTNMIHERILDQEKIRCTSYRARLTKETGDQEGWLTKMTVKRRLDCQAWNLVVGR